MELIIMGIFMCIAFCLGKSVNRTENRTNIIKSAPKKLFKSKKEKKMTVEEQNELDNFYTSLENLENYNGTPYGQQDLKE